MNIFKKFYCRAYQTVFRILLPFLPYREPKILGGMSDVADLLKKEGKKKAVIVTDGGIFKLGLTDGLTDALSKAGIDFILYTEVTPNPTITQVERVRKIFVDNGADSIIAFGGGSSIDCAKIAAARVVKPKQSVGRMKGILRIGKKLPLFIAIPTTAGTGSEVTLAAVITDDKTHYKYPINDFCLIPQYAVLDPAVTLGLPPQITATTGMDALTHAVEAYIGRSTTRYTRKKAIEATKLINENLLVAYNDGKNVVARKNMLHAAYCAGIAFTQSYVGYVHAVAHALGGKYNTAHGLANAVILPYFLEEYGKSATKKLAKLAKATDVAAETDDNATAAAKFIARIKELNSFMNIPEHVEGIKEEDIPQMAENADKEANPLYPVPRLMDAEQLSRMFKKVGGLH